MTLEQEQRIDDSYGQVAHETFVTTYMPGRRELSHKERWRLLSSHERHAWIEVGKKVRGGCTLQELAARSGDVSGVARDLIAAEAAIARVRALLPEWRNLAVAWPDIWANNFANSLAEALDAEEIK